MPVKPKAPRKSLAVTGRDAIASHKEVSDYIQCHRICLAADLFHAAEEQSASGDHRLLSYCTGSNGGMKRSLQTAINRMLAAEALSTGGSAIEVPEAISTGGSAIEVPAAQLAESAPSSAEDLQRSETLSTLSTAAAHATALEAACLAELKHRAHQGPVPQEILEPRQVQHRMKSSRPSQIAAAQVQVREVEVRNARNQKKLVVQDIVLFDSYERRAEIIFSPRGGIWRLRDYYELLVACCVDEVLAGTTPSQAVEGGFSFPRSEAGWHQMLRAGVVPDRVPFAELSADKRTAVAAELRFGMGCGALRWQMPVAPGSSGLSLSRDGTWIDLMPQDPAFETDILSFFVAEERLVRLWAYRHLEDRQMQAFVVALQACGHIVQQTTGFHISRNASTENLFCITGSRALSSRHKAGANRSAPFALCVGQALDNKGPSPRFNMLGSATSKDERPVICRAGMEGATRLRKLIKSQAPALMDVAAALVAAPLATAQVAKRKGRQPAREALQATSSDDDAGVEDPDCALSPPSSRKRVKVHVSDDEAEVASDL